MSATAKTIAYPPELPVSQRRDDIARAIAEHQVVIIAGATGSGKTTQLPKILLELGRMSIGHTQPRRIAARTIAERIAEELGEEVGGLVGYQVRFSDRVGKDTRIKLMTDGILLNEIHRDRDLKRYDAIIIDEAHERSLTVDFLLGYLKQLLPRRPDLKLIITSATIDPESFSRHFGGAPILEVSGRTFPVEIRYRPLVSEAYDEDQDAASSRDLDPLEGIIEALGELEREEPGDVLVFLSGESEIRDAADAIKGRVSLPNRTADPSLRDASEPAVVGPGSTRGGTATGGTEVLPLYGRLSSADQHKVFRRSPGSTRRIVLATNVAETSLTVPGIRYVIDAGNARISRYSTRSKIQRLPIEAISQASANQRSGRSGRTSPGIAIRLYSESDFDTRPEYTEPEILRTNLAAVILQMISLGLGDIESFPFLQPPDSRGIKDGLDLLTELHAIELKPLRVTRLGKQLAQLPIDPRLARMILESGKHGTTREVMAIVAGISIQDPRERPLDKRAQADQAHARFIDKTSDFITLLNLWDYLKTQERTLSGNQFRRMCRAQYLNFLRIREWADVYRQLTRLAKPLGLTVGDAPGRNETQGRNADGIHRSILAGLLSQIGIRDAAKREYVGARQSRFVIFPGSALAKKQPAAVMSAELVETSRLFARVNAAIDPAWAEPIAGDAARRTHSEPHWEKKQGAAVAFERVTLYGVPIIERRRVQFASIDLGYARELFIRHALVEGEWEVDRLDRRLTAFDRDNRALRKDLSEVEERTRRRDILYDDEAIYQFYNRRIPEDVASVKTFEGWWKRVRTETPDLLTMREEDLVEDEVESVESAYPSTWEHGDQSLALSYRFEPGAADDGVTVQVPIALLPRLSFAGFDWQVSGFREELVTALIKSLPKAIRRNVVPAADWARKLLAALPSTGSGSLTEHLAREITAQTFTPVTAADFDLDRLPAHLRMTFAVLDERGETVASGKTLSALQLQLAPKARESVARAVESPADNLERAGITTWDFDVLDSVREVKQGPNTIRAYPALVDEVTSVAIRLMSTAEDQAVAHRSGVRRMLGLATPSPVSYVKEHLTGAEKLILAQSPYRSTAELFDDCLSACIDAVVAGRDIRSRAEFELARDELSAGILETMFATASLVATVVSAGKEADRAIRASSSMALIAPLNDAREQLAALIHPGFVSSAGLARLRRIPVYLKGIVHRIDRLSENVGRDTTWMLEVKRAIDRYLAAGGTLPKARDAEPQIEKARWMLEELRLSLFAQHLGTAEPVSLQRITRVLES